MAAAVAVALASLLGVQRPWLAAVPMFVLWTPTTVAILLSRYVSRRWDDQPVVLMSGLRISRGNFRLWMAAQSAEGVIAGTLVVAMALALLASPSGLAWLAPVFALAGLYAVTARVLRVRLGRGIVALAESDPDSAIAAVKPILAWVPLAWSLAPAARLVRVQAFVLMGDRDAAIAECDRVRVAGAASAASWRALLTATESQSSADTALSNTPRSIGEAWHQALLYALLALHRGDHASFDAAASHRVMLAKRLDPAPWPCPSSSTPPDGA